MYRETSKRLLFVCAAVILLRPDIFAQEEATKHSEAQKETTELRVQVTGGEEAAPVIGATVYIEWEEEGETKRREGTTNRQGIAGPYQIPRVKVFIQVTTEDGEWEKNGGDFDLKDEKQTIKINLIKKMAESNDVGQID